jgi:hypothetical protein
MDDEGQSLEQAVTDVLDSLAAWQHWKKQAESERDALRAQLSSVTEDRNNLVEQCEEIIAERDEANAQAERAEAELSVWTQWSERASFAIGYKPLHELEPRERLDWQIAALNRNLDGEIAEHERHHETEARLQSELDAERAKWIEPAREALRFVAAMEDWATWSRGTLDDKMVGDESTRVRKLLEDAGARLDYLPLQPAPFEPKGIPWWCNDCGAHGGSGWSHYLQICCSNCGKHDLRYTEDKNAGPVDVSKLAETTPKTEYRYFPGPRGGPGDYKPVIEPGVRAIISKPLVYGHPTESSPSGSGKGVAPQVGQQSAHGPALPNDSVSAERKARVEQNGAYARGWNDGIEACDSDRVRLQAELDAAKKERDEANARANKLQSILNEVTGRISWATVPDGASFVVPEPHDATEGELIEACEYAKRHVERVTKELLDHLAKHTLCIREEDLPTTGLAGEIVKLRRAAKEATARAEWDALNISQLAEAQRQTCARAERAEAKWEIRRDQMRRLYWLAWDVRTKAEKEQDWENVGKRLDDILDEIKPEELSEQPAPPEPKGKCGTCGGTLKQMESELDSARLKMSAALRVLRDLRVYCDTIAKDAYPGSALPDHVVARLSKAIGALEGKAPESTSAAGAQGGGPPLPASMRMGYGNTPPSAETPKTETKDCDCTDGESQPCPCECHATESEREVTHA